MSENKTPDKNKEGDELEKALADIFPGSTIRKLSDQEAGLLLNPTSASSGDATRAMLSLDKQDLVQRLREMAKEWNPGDPHAPDYAWHEYRTLVDAADALSASSATPEFSDKQEIMRLAHKVIEQTYHIDNLPGIAHQLAEALLSATRESVLEEAAKVCEQMRPINPPTRAVQMQRETLDNAARLIRALKKTQYVGEKK